MYTSDNPDGADATAATARPPEPPPLLGQRDTL